MSTSKDVAPQVTSSQILREAFESKQLRWQKPQQSIQDLVDLRSFQITKRREYEQQINKNRLNYGQWLRYAKWEVEFNRDFARARSIYERALEVDVEHVPFWTQYIRMELNHRNANHARNLLERGVTILPRIHKLWFMYVQTEEILGHFQTVRTIFERWLSWHPTPEAWDAYINYEKRYEEYENMRSIFRRYVKEFNDLETWIKWIKVESSVLDNVPQIRKVYELAANAIIRDTSAQNSVEIFIDWAKWEASVREPERASAIFSELLDESKFKFTPEKRKILLNGFSNFERQHGNLDTIEQSIRIKRKVDYEQELANEPYNYDSWWAFIDLLKDDNDVDGMKNTFTRCLETIPPVDNGKTVYWRRSILIGIRFAMWTEFDQSDIEGAKAVWDKLLQAIPHKKFTFGKAWIQAAEFEIRNGRQSGLIRARKLLGRGIGLTSRTGKPSLFKFYIELERKLGELERARKLFEKWIEIESRKGPDNLWLVVEHYIAFEEENGEMERCRSLFRFMLELNNSNVWQLYIQFEKDSMNYAEARSIFERYVKSNGEPSAWISYALFESSIPTEEQLRLFEEQNEDLEFEITDLHRQHTRDVFKRALRYFSGVGLSEERLVVLRAWQGYETEHGDEASAKEVEKLLPTFVKKRRVNNGVEEEYIEYDFPGDEELTPANPSINKFLQNARLWAAKNG